MSNSSARARIERCWLLLGWLLLVGCPAHADEGMWLVNAFPVDVVQRVYGSAPDAAMLDRLQHGVIRLAGGCSASLVSGQGLVMTNHHCVRSCLQDLSGGRRDLLNQPFLAPDRDHELRCDKFEANQLIAIEDVSDVVIAATRGLQGAAFEAKLKAEKARIEGACAVADGEGEAARRKRRCDVVTLFDGAAFHLYTYRRFQDVRLVFAPEFPMASFGGDPDNFNFPRFGLDMAFLRIWNDGKPLVTDDALHLAGAAVKEGDLVYVAGHPGGTERQRTALQLELQRDVAVPWTLLRLAEMRGRLAEWINADHRRLKVGRARLRSIENSLKAQRGRFQTLAEVGFMDHRRDEDRQLAGETPEVAAAFHEIELAMAEARRLWAGYRLVEGAEAFDSELFRLARLVVRLEAEKTKPDGERLTEFTEAKLPAVVQQLSSPTRIPLDFEAATLGWSLDRLRNLRGVDDPLVQRVLGTRSATRVARDLVDKTRIADPKARALAVEGKLDLADDPMVKLARLVDDEARAIRKEWEDGVDARETHAAEALAAARRVRRGTTGYPDATFTLRISFGTVRGTRTAPPWTTVGGLLARASDEAPFALSPSWVAARGRVDGARQMNLSTTNDIIGGNSGSPLLDREGRVVGLVFDGNLASLGGRYTYEAEENRTVAVAGEVILEALVSVYGAERIVDELKAP